MEKKSSERLQKLISQAGISSRRAAEELITSGQVTVNGQVVTELGSKADPARDIILVNGVRLQLDQKRLYILLNKPVGYMATLDDPEGRPLVTDLLKDVPQRVYPVGRLDYNTEGLLLLTNDGEWANRLMHPRNEIAKEYHVRVRGKIHQSQLDLLGKGVELDGRNTAPAIVRIIKHGEHNDWFSITIHEGRNRQVRRMCEAVSLSVVRLKRVRYGNLEIGGLKAGEFRMLSEAEVRGLAQPGVRQADQPKTRAAQKAKGSAGEGPKSTAKDSRQQARKGHAKPARGTAKGNQHKRH